MELNISFIPYNSGAWDLIIGYDNGGDLKGEITLTKDTEVSTEELDILQEIAPMFVWTKYAKLGD